MQAKVISNVDGITDVIVRRSLNRRTLYGRHYDLHVGDKVTVKRQTNNPCLVRVVATTN